MQFLIPLKFHPLLELHGGRALREAATLRRKISRAAKTLRGKIPLLAKAFATEFNAALGLCGSLELLALKKFHAEAFRAKILGAEILHAAMFASGAEISRKARIAIVFAILRDMFLSAA